MTDRTLYLLSSAVAPRVPPAGSTTLTLPEHLVAAVIDDFAPHGGVPALEALLADTQPYRVGTAKGVTAIVTYSDLWAAIAEMQETWTRLDDAARQLVRIGSIMSALRLAARWPMYVPAVEDHWNHSYTHERKQAAWRHARWRGRAESAVLRYALADRFTAAVAAGPPHVRWGYSAAWRLLGIEATPPAYFSYIPPAALMFNPPPLDALPSPCADGFEACTRLYDGLRTLPVIGELAPRGYLMAQAAITFLVATASQCLSPLDAGPSVQAESWRVANESLAAWLLDHPAELN